MYVFFDYLLCLEVVVLIFDYVVYVNLNKVVDGLILVELCDNLNVYLLEEV